MSNASNWNYQPEGKVGNNPLFFIPVNVTAVLSWYCRSWKPTSENAILLVFALVTVLWLQPTMIIGESLTWSTMIQMYCRNFIYMLLVAGGFHYYFYIGKFQGDSLKYEQRQFSKDRKYTFSNQVWDNMFWTLASGVLFWTGYEVFLLQMQIQGLAPLVQWSNSLWGNIWFIVWLLLIPSWVSLHFYFGHRFLHWALMYKYFHSLHHRNINVGPWSGLSMHPVEHLIYMSSLLIHLVVPSDPLHIFFHAYGLTLSTVFGHVGYDALLFKGKKIMALGRFHHQLHHRHFECNYGGTEMPCDIWFDSFDDGSPEARQYLRVKMLNKMKVNKVKG